MSISNALEFMAFGKVGGSSVVYRSALRARQRFTSKVMVLTDVA